MKKNHLKHFDLDLYQETLPNGLLINVIPKEGNNIYVTFITRYGSFHNTFIPYQQKKYYEAPMGVAHFLEHKVFEQKEGEDPFVFYTRNGADANASTSYLRTCYLFSGPGHVCENIEYLLDFVQNPYFTDENVEKEKGIIEQEIKMYEDIPYWKLLERSLENTLQKHPLRYPIAGTVDSIRKITKEDLYTCYDTFYHPSNMFMTVVGNVDPKEVIETIQNNQAKKDYQSREPVKIKQVTEPDTVVKKEDTVTSDNVEIPKLSIAYKIPVRDFDKQKFHFFLNFYFDLRLGSTSLLLERLRKELAITGEISVDVMEADQHFVCVVSVETKKPEYVCEEIDKELRLKQVSEEEFNRKRKTLKSGCVYQSDSVYTIASHVNSQLLRMNTILLDEYAWIDSLKWKEFQKAIQSLPLENRSVVTLLKKSESL